MNKVRFLQLVIVFLLITNILLLLFGFVLRKPHHDHDRPKRIVIEQLGFNTSQIKRYEKFIDLHRKQIREKDKEIILLKGRLYSLLKSPKQSAEEDSLTAKIGKAQQEIETIHFNHFLQIKSICREDQLDEFDKLAEELTSVFMMQRKGPGSKE